ncbi:MAG TPA: hypothetical protein VGR35_02800 [Tepidisphaeraceae bacterium]|nr:hypothetical protein [Tepidisphaeraceae bacterium]
MKRKLYNLCTLGSLLLLCGSLWWWNHSSRNTDQVSLHGVGGASVQVTGSGGQVMLTKAMHHSRGGGELRWNSSAHGGGPKLLATSFTFKQHPQKGMTLILPTWALALVFAILPSLWVYSKVHGKGGKKKKPEAQ